MSTNLVYKGLSPDSSEILVEVSVISSVINKLLKEASNSIERDILIKIHTELGMYLKKECTDLDIKDFLAQLNSKEETQTFTDRLKESRKNLLSKETYDYYKKQAEEQYEYYQTSF